MKKILCAVCKKSFTPDHPRRKYHAKQCQHLVRLQQWKDYHHRRKVAQKDI